MGGKGGNSSDLRVYAVKRYATWGMIVAMAREMRYNAREGIVFRVVRNGSSVYFSVSHFVP
jgi:hypothetical protein